MFKEIVKNLNNLKNEKITIIKFSEFGFPIAINTKIKETFIKSYAQYDEALYILHRPKRKRMNYRNIILPYQKVLIYDGWISLPKHILNFENGDFIISKYTSFDQQYFSDIEKELGKPLVKIN